MIISIHQPQYLPWLGYFNKINQSDVFVLLDDVQFKKNEWQNRNKIKTSQEWQWLTVPVIHNFGQRLNGTCINNNTNWQRSHINAIEFNYKKAPFFNDYFPAIKDALAKEWIYLSNINSEMIFLLKDMLDIKTKIVRSSAIKTSEHPTQRLIDLCKAFDGDTYLSGIDGSKYMDLKMFSEQGINIITQNYAHPIYPQVQFNKKNNNFISNLSIIDLLFNCGKKSLEILTTKAIQL